VPNLAALVLAFGGLILMENQHNVRRAAQARWPWSKAAA